ncbi:MAG TPA: hypothetical protein VFG51_03310 [Candidatus Saccharimonadia bacterium]|nr:hypothetical protein [Candidatus Saccharimonadia bacterium]
MNSTFKTEVAAVLSFGLSGFLLFFSYRLMPISILLFLIGVVLSAVVLAHSIVRVTQWPRRERLFLIPFALLAASHAVGLFLPETGFDAVWYHLPITTVFLSLHHLAFIPDLYQSAMPQLGSLLFAVPFLFLRESGVKVFCYLVTLLLSVIVFQLARRFLPRHVSVLVVLFFFGLHTVAWQASSAYVDQIIALFELMAILAALRTQKSVVIPGIFLGLALSMKLLVLFFLPAFIVFFWIQAGWRHAVKVTFTALLIVSPWYVQAFIWTGNPLYPLFQVLHGTTILHDIGVNSWKEWLVGGAVKFVVLPIYLSLHRESFTTPIFAFSTLFLYLARKRLISKRFRALSLTTLAMFTIWLLIPPLSVRYVLTGIVFALILAISAIWDEAKKRGSLKKIFYTVCVVSFCLSFAIRLGANVVAAPYLTGSESYENYIATYSQGIAQGPMTKWYAGYWEHWTPKTRP